MGLPPRDFKRVPALNNDNSLADSHSAALCRGVPSCATDGHGLVTAQVTSLERGSTARLPEDAAESPAVTSHRSQRSRNEASTLAFLTGMTIGDTLMWLRVRFPGAYNAPGCFGSGFWFEG